MPKLIKDQQHCGSVVSGGLAVRASHEPDGGESKVSRPGKRRSFILPSHRELGIGRASSNSATNSGSLLKSWLLRYRRNVPRTRGRVDLSHLAYASVLHGFEDAIYSIGYDRTPVPRAPAASGAVPGATACSCLHVMFKSSHRNSGGVFFVGAERRGPGLRLRGRS